LSRRSHAERVLSWKDAASWRRNAAGRVAFTNGVFDLLHPGHVDLLRHARAQGDVLIVGVNSDASVRRLKGPDRPIRSEEDRAYVLAALRDVDAVVLFSEDTPLELIRHLRPDVLVKGADYTPDTVVGRADVESWGGRVEIAPLRPGHSTTALVERLRDRA
jgi:rfaE bifunctional protein nucleotidyltransferase chain/domain